MQDIVFSLHVAQYPRLQSGNFKNLLQGMETMCMLLSNHVIEVQVFIAVWVSILLAKRHLQLLSPLVLVLSVALSTGNQLAEYKQGNGHYTEQYAYLNRYEDLDFYDTVAQKHAHLLTVCPIARRSILGQELLKVIIDRQ